ncbi:rhodanese-like domain-containing protein [Nocardia cyriacigeorgica]|uniref:rhodanese-like domain-containing protein n=1 Tax=Nocardia cyriacigeorgica TaxID=135487 RepID=UPI001E379F77|nr:rhodanese-like domain-containing protein [Nocardia cyriacigeorgica]
MGIVGLVRGWQVLLLICLLAVELTACWSGGEPDLASPSTTVRAESSRLLPPAEFAAAMAEPARVTINVHVPFEGYLDGTDRMIPYNEISSQAAQLPADRATPLAIYCLSGRMSVDAMQALVALGYTDVVDLRGGMQAWQADGRPVLLTLPTGVK